MYLCRTFSDCFVRLTTGYTVRFEFKHLPQDCTPPLASPRPFKIGKTTIFIGLEFP